MNSENVAVGKVATMSSFNLPQSRHSACLAVNGQADNDTRCTESASGDYNSTWEVDLGQPYVIKAIVIYRRDYCE